MLQRIDEKEGLYVLSAGEGVTCLGFDVARDRTRQYAELLGESLPDPFPYGTAEAFRLYSEVEQRLAKSGIARRLTIYGPHTPDDLIAVLESARLANRRIRLFYGKRETGRDWNEENDVEGYLGRTTGTIHCPILLKSKFSAGGPIILSGCIVKVIATADKRILWQHPAYHSLPFRIAATPKTDLNHRRYPIEVLRADEVHARFETRAQAERFIRKMTGA